MSSNQSLIRVLSEFDARVRELTSALANEAARRAPFAMPGADSERRSCALRLASARRLWFLAPVPAEAFLSAGNRLATVAAHALKPILSARALYDCRDAIRRCVDRETKRALSLSMGTTAFAALQAHALTSTSGQPLPDDLTADALAHRGWALILADGACADPTLRRTVELGLAVSAGGDIWQNVLAAERHTSLLAGDFAADEVKPGMSATDEFLSIAGNLFPEFQWLFG
ncbi:type III secretion protein HrpB4 [Trinickia sp.]|uniref:type III secretion protein HrpB4 n=1 Tax=Trinickia sp. TaxID=2571163 RepID=UPI003F7EE949